MRGATNGRVAIRPGDFVLCDEDGGIVIPSVHVAEVLDQAEQLTQKEILIRRELENGLALQQALDKYGHV